MAEVGATPTDQRLLERIGDRSIALTSAEAAVDVGLPLAVVEPRLLALAVASGAQLRVSGAGEVSYVFPAHLRRLLHSRSWRLRARAGLRRLWAFVFRLVRCAFGVVLVLLVLVVSVLVLALGLVMLARLDDDAGDVLGAVIGGSLELLVRLAVAVCSDQLWYGSPGSYPRAEGQTAPKRVAFLESVYSILFGDGDPNSGLEQRRWKRIGAVLQRRGGVVIAEDLAPLLDLPAPPSDCQLGSDWADQAMLPVLLHFDGRPEVSEQGQLIYHFHALQGSTSADTPFPAQPLRERRIRFSRASQDQRLGYAALTGTLLLLSLVLLQWSLPVSTILVVIAELGLSYALLLLGVPLLRALVLRRSNAVIQARNRLRQRWAAWAQTHVGSLDVKRQLAAQRRRAHSNVDAAPVYTTEQDLITQEIDT